MIVPELTGQVRWDASQLMRQQHGVRRRYLFKAGGTIRTTARRSLRKARRIRVSELPDEAQEEYREALEDFRAGHRDRPPVLNTIVSDPYNPPLLQMSPSPLRNGLRFSVDKGAETVVIGPERSNEGIAGDLEFGRGKIRKPRPFMRPAYQKTLPQLPSLFRSAVR